MPTTWVDFILFRTAGLVTHLTCPLNRTT